MFLMLGSLLMCGVVVHVNLRRTKAHKGATPAPAERGLLARLENGKFCDDDGPSERPANLPKADLVHHLSSSGELRD